MNHYENYIIYFFLLGLYFPLNVQTDEKINCDSAMTQYEMNGCAQQRFTKADDELNKVYKAILNKLRKENNEEEYKEIKENGKKIINALIQAQRKWIEYRDAYCKVYELQYEGGSMMPLMYYGVMESLTKSRTEELKILLEELNN